MIQTCSRRSTASGLASWFSSKVSCRKFSASADMSEGIVGLAEEPICRKVINHDRSHARLGTLSAYLEDGLHLAQLRPRVFPG